MNIICDNTGFFDIMKQYEEHIKNKEEIRVSLTELESDLDSIKTASDKYNFFNKYFYNKSKIIIKD